MTGQDTLQDTIGTLINHRAEGPYWDFKRRHHQSKGDLIHDVLCLANANHRGSRYLVFGVDDRELSLHSMAKDPGRRTQADIVSIFRDNASKFFQTRFPQLYLTEITVDGVLLDVLVVADTPQKPYYLVERYEKVCAHHIYTRVCDTNTPVTDAAHPHEIERMWRERFGLDMLPLDRVKLYLSDVDAWTPNNKNGENLQVHHKTFPEFTLKVVDAEEYMARHEEWTRGEHRTDNNHAGYYEIYYHQTCLGRVLYVSFDDHKKSMVAPNLEPRGAGRFYFYEIDGINYAIQRYHAAMEGADHSKKLSIRGRGKLGKEARSRWDHYLEIPVLRMGELDGFLGEKAGRQAVEASRNEAEQYELFLRNQLDFEYWRQNSEED